MAREAGEVGGEARMEALEKNEGRRDDRIGDISPVHQLGDKDGEARLPEKVGCVRLLGASERFDEVAGAQFSDVAQAEVGILGVLVFRRDVREWLFNISDDIRAGGDVEEGRGVNCQS